MDKAWFFVSYRRVERTNDIATLDTAEFLRTVDTTENQWYVRGTVSPGSSDTVSFTYFSDPFDRSGRLERDITNARDRSRVQGGDNFRLAWSHLFGTDVLFDANWSKHNGEVSDFTVIPGALNDISFRGSDVRTLEDEQKGGWGQEIIDQRDGQQVVLSANWAIEQHDIKGGFEWGERTRLENNRIPEGQYTSLANHLSGTTALGVSTGNFSNVRFDPTNTSDINGFNATVRESPRRQEFLNAFDLNRDGFIDGAELGVTLRYDSTADNPHGAVNYERRVQVQEGPLNFKVRDLGWFVQDTFSYGDFVFNLGLRAEDYTHFASDDSEVSFFPWTWAPRLSAVYDIGGQGRQKATAFWGRYYDPIRLNMTDFAGSLTGAILHEQVFALGEWVTYRIRGGPQQADALFAPSTQTPVTTDLQLSYEIELAPKMSFQALYTHRKTDDILEDYDMCLYNLLPDGTTCYPGPVDHPDSLFLGLDYFGYDEFPVSNFVIATLAGGKRTYDGVEFVFRKRYADGWQALASYTYSDGEGNTNSDSNADFQGDVLFLDPRAPNQLGTQPGLIHHLFKLAGTYRFDMGLELGAFYRWNSGTVASTTFRAFNRNLPVRDTVFEFAGITQRWIEPDTVGSLENPSFGIVDLRVQYYINQGGRVTGQVFADIFNVSNYQGSTRDQDLRAGQGTVAFGDPIKFNRPRSLFLGVRVNW
jgi:hypothetical protein